MKSKFALPAAIAATCLAFADTSRAAAYTETGDAGDLPATAQIVTGTGGTTLDSITGALTLTNAISDGDMFEIYISSPSAFSANTTVFVPNSNLNNFDTQLFLFSASGLGVLANDDSPNGGQQSSIPAANFSGPAGLYYLLIDGSGRYPVSSGGLIFPNQNDGANGGLGDDPTTVYGPTGPGGSSAISGYTGNSNEGGGYRITLTGAQFVPATVPEPGTYALVLAGAAGIVYAGRRRQAAR